METRTGVATNKDEDDRSRSTSPIVPSFVIFVEVCSYLGMFVTIDKLCNYYLSL